MNAQQEARLKQMAEERYLQQANNPSGSTIGGCGMAPTPAQPSFLEMVEMRINRAERDQMTLRGMHELRDLLVKNPEVARILELRDNLRHLL